MFIEHFEKNFQYSDRELVLIARKLGKLATYCKRAKDEGSRIRVEAEKRDTKKGNDRMKVMVTVYLPQRILRAESRRSQVIDALDRCIEKLEPQIKRYKELHIARGVLHRDLHIRADREEKRARRKQP
jgi:ribosomal subunit interface protein